MFWPFSTIRRLRRENERLENSYKELKTRYGDMLTERVSMRNQLREMDRALDSCYAEIRALRNGITPPAAPIVAKADPILPQKKVTIETEPKRTYESVRSSDDTTALAVAAAVTAAIITSDGAEAAIRVVEPAPSPAPAPQPDYSGGGGDTGGGGASASFSTD